MIWKTALPAGHSSPVLTRDRIFVTAFDATKLYVITLDRATGKILWRREVPRPRKQELHKSNSPASPSVATDGKNTYAFFTDFGLVSHGSDGEELWRVPLAQFNNPFGMGASPILANGKVIQVCDSETGSFMIAVDQQNGRVAWRVERPDMTRGFSTPVLYQPRDGGLQILVAGTNRFIAYEVDTGKEIWSVRGLTWQMKPTPCGGWRHRLYSGWAGAPTRAVTRKDSPYADVLRKGTRTRTESPRDEADPRYRTISRSPILIMMASMTNANGEIPRKRSSVNSVMAVRLPVEAAT